MGRKKLPSETNTSAIGREVESDFQASHGVGRVGHVGSSTFEHGQWWVTCPCYCFVFGEELDVEKDGIVG
jgi:hypothetical protein